MGTVKIPERLVAVCGGVADDFSWTVYTRPGHEAGADYCHTETAHKYASEMEAKYLVVRYNMVNGPCWMELERNERPGVRLKPEGRTYV